MKDFIVFLIQDILYCAENTLSWLLYGEEL